MIWQLTIYVLSQVIFNITNAHFDAYLIFKHKTVAHWVNFGTYAIIIGIQVYLGHFVWWYIIIFCLSALFNRQISFDIPLNIRRGKTDASITWDYVSKAERPAAWWDRMEIAVFGRNGRKIAIAYMILWGLSLTALYIFKP